MKSAKDKPESTGCLLQSASGENVNYKDEAKAQPLGMRGDLLPLWRACSEWLLCARLQEVDGTIVERVPAQMAGGRSQVHCLHGDAVMTHKHFLQCNIANAALVLSYMNVYVGTMSPEDDLRFI